MINFNKVTENFSKVYEHRNSPNKRFFLNSSLEIVEDESQKASFFDVIESLQFRKWQVKEGISETPQQMNKLWLQARHIYDNQPYSIYDQSRVIQLFQLSVTTGSFQNEKKLRVHELTLSIYVEIFYLIKLIFSVEETLANLSENTQVPPNLQIYYDFLHQKYAQVVAFQKTKEFDALKTLKNTNPLTYLSVFIKEEEGKIIESYPEFLQLFELAEEMPTPSHPHKANSKKKKSYNFTPEKIRNQMRSILKKSFPNDSKFDHKLLLATLYSNPKETTTTSEEYKELIKSKMGSHEEMYDTIKKIIKEALSLLNNEIRANDSVLLPIEALKRIFDNFKKKLFVPKGNEADGIPLPISELYFIQKTHNAYVEALKTIIETLKRDFSVLKVTPNTSNDTIIKNEHGDVVLQIPGGKYKFVKNKERKFGKHYIEFINQEKNIVSEYFPTLYNHSNYLDNKKYKLQAKKEIEAVNSVYPLLIKELSKIALVNLSNNINCKPCSEYLYLIHTLVPSCDSFPTPEEFTSLRLKNPIHEFYSLEDVKRSDELIAYFEEERATIYQNKMKVYCEEYVTQKSTFLEKPEVFSEESFVKTLDIPPKEECNFDYELPSIKPEKPRSFQQESGPSSSAIASPIQEMSSRKQKKEVIKISKNVVPAEASSKTIIQNEKSKKNKLTSLRKLPWVEIDKKIPNFSYHSRVKRWIHNPEKALSDPAYKNLITTKDFKERTLFFHSFPKIIDTLLPTDYCSMESETKDGKRVMRYNISAKIIMLGIEYEGAFCYTIDSATKTCYHRCFDSIIESEAKVSNFHSSKYYFDNDVSIEIDEQTQMIRLYDPNFQAEIYL